MSRTRTPTKVLEIRGSFKRHPERAREREGEPIPTGKLGPPPASLSVEAKKAWYEMEAEGGVWLTNADRFMVEIASCLMAIHRVGVIENPQRSLLVSTLSKLGFGPTERSKIKAPTGKPVTSGFEKFKAKH